MPEFHASAEDIHLDDGHILKARLINSDGEHVDAEVDLNDFIGNVDGTPLSFTRSPFAAPKTGTSFDLQQAPSSGAGTVCYTSVFRQHWEKRSDLNRLLPLCRIHPLRARGQ